MSQRNLHRGLEGEGTTFRTVRDAVVWEAVEALLSNPSLKLEAVALSVGFADLAAFSKAFRRWTGCAPARYRERVVASGRDASHSHTPANESPDTQKADPLSAVSFRPLAST